MIAENEATIDDSVDQTAQRRGRIASRVSGAVAVVALIAFLVFFDPTRNQWLVDSLWLLALYIWVIEVRRRAGGRLLDLQVRWADVLPIVAVVTLFVAAWIPYYNNWRWAWTGDGIGWFGYAQGTVVRGVSENLLSVRGVDDHFTVLNSVSFNEFMYVFGPTFFWHRMGKLLLSVLSLCAIYAYFAVALGRYWSIAIVLATATNYVWIWFSYISYPHINSYLFYFSTLTFALLIWRRPEQLGWWMCCGLTAGLALFFTETSWSAVAAVGIVLTVFALMTRRLQALVILAGSFVLAGLPLLLQIPGLMQMASRQAKVVLEMEYVKRIFLALVMLPYDSQLNELGVQGAFLRWPFGTLYLVGAAISVVALLPPLRRALRIPAVAPVLLLLLLWDIVLMTVTNNGYGWPSTKRCYSLIPIEIFFAYLPFCVLSAWCGPRWLKPFAPLLAVVAFGVYVPNNFRLMMFPPAGIYGSNMFDGLIELHQRYPSRQVVLATSREDMLKEFAPDGIHQQAYSIIDRMRIDTVFTPRLVEHACEQQAILCYEPNFDRERMQPLLEQFPAALKPFPLLNSKELVCDECIHAVSRQ